MKKLMLGNEAVARGLYEGGCSFVSSYPGTPSTEITEIVAKYDERGAEAVGHSDRFDFYDEARQVYCIIATSEAAVYANVMLQKGVV